jgi:hypothetical protein
VKKRCGLCITEKRNIDDTLKWSTFEEILSRSLQLSEMLLLYGQTFSDPNNQECQVFVTPGFYKQYNMVKKFVTMV